MEDVVRRCTALRAPMVANMPTGQYSGSEIIADRLLSKEGEPRWA